MLRRAHLLAISFVLAFAALFSRPPIHQDAAYHHFADGRPLAGIPNALNVLSNAPFAIAGALGLVFMVRSRPRLSAGENVAFAIVFAGVLFTALGSGYYHLEPSDARLFWDRLPMTFVFMAVYGIVLCERVLASAPARIRRAVVPVLVGVGVASAVVWRITGDLRLYALVQFFPLASMPFLLLFFSARESGTRELVLVIVLYAIAKGFEVADESILRVSAIVSGHTLKHLAAASATFLLVRFARARAA